MQLLSGFLSCYTNNPSKFNPLSVQSSVLMWLSLLGQMGPIIKMKFPLSFAVLDFEELDLVKHSSVLILCHHMLLHSVIHIDLSIYRSITWL